MKKILYIALCFTVLLAGACKKHDFAEGDPSPIIALLDVRSLYKGTDVQLNRQNMLGAFQIVGKVISNPDSGNVTAGMVVLQNNRRHEIRGITIPLGDAANDYHLGDSLVINIDGAILTKVNGAMQLKGLTGANISKISTGNDVSVQQTSSLSIKAHPDVYDGTLVRIKSATLSPAPVLGETKFAGDRFLVNGADSIALHTEAGASFADTDLPAGATISGVLVINTMADSASIYQVWPRDINDVTDITKPADPNAPDLGVAPVIITGFVNDAKGADGNYEYFQFKATQNIDFEKTPMAVVTCTNAGSAEPFKGDAPGGGWATGGGRTYKFNLTAGQVKKGQFFYVGGSNKRIDGPNSTDISEAFWAAAITYTTTDGDGFGSSSSGLLPNSGNAGGIAIFAGINVTEQSVPVDAVFFGGNGKTTIYNATANTGYRIPKNDHYDPMDVATNTEQPFFYQGTNLYVIPHVSPADQGVFMKLGGVFDAATKLWITPRGITVYPMSQSTELAEIENGDVTDVIN